MRDMNPAILERLIVVESFEPRPSHSVVTLRRFCEKHWVVLFVRKPLEINFGDFVLSEPNESGLFVSGDFLLERGPNLHYHLVLDDLPDYFVKLLSGDQWLPIDAKDDTQFHISNGNGNGNGE